MYLLNMIVKTESLAMSTLNHGVINSPDRRVTKLDYDCIAFHTLKQQVQKQNGCLIQIAKKKL